jgi:hypothetical protein
MSQETETTLETKAKPESKAPEAESESKDLFTRLAGVGEDAIQRIAEIPRLTRLTDTVNGLRTKVDELQRRVRGLDELERRVGELEKRVEELSAKPGSRRRSSAKPSSGEASKAS